MKEKELQKVNVKLQEEVGKTQLALEFVENIVKTVRESLLILDSNLRVVSASRFFYQTFKVNEEDTIGEFIYNLGNRQWNITSLVSLLKETLPKKMVIEDYEVEHNFQDIGQKIMLLNARELIQEEGKKRMILVSIQDVTDRRNAEKRLKILNEELEEKARQLQQILYVTTHDLRSPLVNIQGFSKELEVSLSDLSKILDRGVFTEDEREAISSILERDVSEALHFINLSTKKMDDLISGLLVLSRLGRQILNMKSLNMNVLINDVLDNFKYEIENRKIKVRIGRLSNCLGDETQINKLFSNLIGNAIKFLDPNRIGEISISGEKHQSHTSYMIDDNGIGIHADYMEKVFELFNKLDPRKPGVGLGLNIAKQVIDSHNGKIEIKSEVGIGTKVIFELPS